MRSGILWGVAALLCAAPGWAAEAVEYHFAPGDVIDVTVAPQHAFDRTVTVQPDGKVSFPVVGPLQAGGLTVAQLADALQAGLDRDLVNPHVTVSLRELNRQAVPRVSVLGAVRNEGVFEIKTGATVAEVLAQAGGPSPLADLRRVVITRADHTTITVDLAQGQKTGHLERNVALQPGDLIIVPEGAPPTVLVLGEVTRSGPVDLHGEMRLLDAISQAGGPTTHADLRRVTVAHPGAAGAQTVDLEPLLHGANPADSQINVVLEPGATIVIPESDQRVYVLGRVGKPDVYPIKPNDRVLDALAKAGGASDGDLGRAVLVRRDERGQPVPRVLDLKKMMAKGSIAENELLRPGDLLYVPDKRPYHSPSELANLVWPITGLLSFFRH